MKNSEIEEQAREFAIEILEEKEALAQAGKITSFRVSDKVRENVRLLHSQCRHSAPTIQRLYKDGLSLPSIFEIINE